MSHTLPIVPLTEREREFVVQHRALAYHFALRFAKHSGRKPDDLIQAAFLGLIRAAQKFEPDKGFAFSTYAKHWISMFVLRENFHSKSMIRRQIQDGPALRAIRDREATTVEEVREIIRARNPSDDRAAALLRIGRASSVSIDVDREDEKPVQLAADRADETAAIDAERALDLATPREREILRLRFFEDMSIADVARARGVSRQRIEQIEKKALARIRRALEREQR